MLKSADGLSLESLILSHLSGNAVLGAFVGYPGSIRAIWPKERSDIKWFHVESIKEPGSRVANRIRIASADEIGTPSVLSRGTAVAEISLPPSESDLRLLIDLGKANPALRPLIKDVFAGFKPGPIGKLEYLERASEGIQRASWYVDEFGERWLLKADMQHLELQTAAEVISSHIYREAGFIAAENYIVYVDGRRFAASRDLGINSLPDTLTIGFDSPLFRQLRVFVSFLEDRDRLRVGPNNFRIGQTGFAMFDFGGTLGSRSRGQHKEGTVVSDAIGSFPASMDAKEIFESVGLRSLPLDHPWRHLTFEDIEGAVQRLRLLTNEKIKEIVSLARYSRKEDSEYMIHALKARRDGLLNGLSKYFKESRETDH